MDKLFLNGMKDGILPEQSSDTSTGDLSHSCSEHDVEGEELCSAEEVVYDGAPATVETTHQPGSQQKTCESTTKEYHSAQEVNCSDPPDQAVVDIHRIIPHSSSSENIQEDAQTAVDVSPAEDTVIAQKLVTQTVLENSHDTGLMKGSVQCYDDSHGKVDVNGFEDASLDPDSKELNEVLFAVLKTDPRGDSEVQESCSSVGTVGSVDGRERFSESSDQSQGSNGESYFSSESTQLVYDRGDQICTSSVSCKSMSDVECGIGGKSTGIESNVVGCNVTDGPCQTSHLCTIGDEISSVTHEPCKRLLYKTLAASVVDEVLEVAAKHLLEPETQSKIVDVMKRNLNCENIQEQMSDNEVTLKDDVSENMLKLDNALDLNCSLHNVSDDVISNVFHDDNILEGSQSNSEVESNTEGSTPVICNGSNMSSSRSTYLSCSCPILNLSVSESGSNVSEYDNDVPLEHPVREDDLKLETVSSSNDGLESCEDFIKHTEEIDSTEKGIVALIQEEKSEDINSSGDKIETNLCNVMVEPSLNDQDLNLMAQVPNGVFMKELSPHLESNPGGVASPSVTPVLCATSLDECEDLNLNNQKPNLEVEKTLNALTASSANNIDADSDLKCAKFHPLVTNALDYIINSSSANDDLGCTADLFEAKVEETIDKKAIEHITPSTSFQENTEKSEPLCSKPNSVAEEVNSLSDECSLVSTLETAEKEQQMTVKGESSVEEVIPTVDSSASDSSPENVEHSKKVICVEEPKTDEVSLKDDIGASIPLLGNEDFAEEEHNSTVLLPELTSAPFVKQTSMETSNASNHSEENGHIPVPTMPCQFIVPTVNICPPIMEETYDGITDDESEISHATSDSESDSNVKMVKPICDGMNTINYRPLLEDDSNDRSTLSLISELDEASVKEDNFDNDQMEDESASLIMDDCVNKVDQVEKDNLSLNSELVQRVKGQRIMHNKIEKVTYIEEKPLEEDADSQYAAKIKEIRDALKSGSLESLRELARSAGGLVNDELRREAWPRLLGIESSFSGIPLPPINLEELRNHHQYNQVVMDVNRSLRRFPSKISPEERVKLQDQLTEIILRVLMKRKDLSYYQGYHDVAVTTLLVAGKDVAFHILERISVAHLSDCMLPTMERTMYLLNFIYPLLQRMNPNVAERMDRLEVGTIFCLPWYLTWYGYSLNRYEDIVRVFDYFLASPQLAPLYLAAVVVGRRSAEVLAADFDHATVHSLLSRIPETLPLEDLLKEATDLYRNYPPDVIENEVQERCERLRKAQEEEEEQRNRIRQRRMIQRRHSMPTIAARQMPGWFFIDRFLGLPMIQGRRIIQVSATVMFGMIAWHLKNEVYRYF